jgi:hypothetical protein
VALTEQTNQKLFNNFILTHNDFANLFLQLGIRFMQNINRLCGDVVLVLFRHFKFSGLHWGRSMWPLLGVTGDYRL